MYRSWRKKTQSHLAYTKNGTYNFSTTTSKLKKIKQQHKGQYEAKKRKHHTNR